MENKPVTNVVRQHRHEGDPASLRNVFIIAASVLILVAACLLSAKLVIGAYAGKRPMQPMQPFGIINAPDNHLLTRLPGPALELDDGHADFMALRQGQLEKLNHYAWADRTHGIARIPIERAMDLIVAAGLPAVTNVPSRGGSALPAIQERVAP